MKQPQNKNNKMISRLESLAKSVLSRFPLVEDSISLARRPFFIEFSGTPKSGKTTGATRLELFFRRNNFRVRTLTERASTCPLRRKDHMFFNVWTACSTLTQMLEALDRDDQIVIIDRGLFDALCWINWLEKTARLTQPEKKIIDDFILLNPWRELTDIVFILSVDPKTALERELAGQLTKRSGSIMNENTLEQFNNSVKSVYNENSSLFRRIIKIDTSNTDPIETVEKITMATLKYLKDFLGEEILVFPKKILSELNIRGGFMSDPKILQKFSDALTSSCSFVDRKTAENNLDYIQPIPIAYFQYKDKYLLLRRSEENHKDRMHEKYVIWAGGHVRKQDNKDGNVIKECLLREIGEELYIKNLPSPELIGLMLDTSGVSSSRHLGIIHRFIIDQPDVAISMDQKEFKERKGKSVSGKFVTSEELATFFDKMERWSQILIVEYLRLIDKPLSHQAVLF